MAMQEVGGLAPSSEQQLGKQLQVARKRVGMTQQELCQRANLSYSTLAKIERGAIKSPSIFTIQSIAGALGVSLAELLGNVGPALPQAKQIAASGVSFVYFDINGCLVRFFHQAFSQLSEDTGGSIDVIESTFWHYNDAVCRGDMSMEEFNGLLAEKLGVPAVDWAQYYLTAVDPILEMQDLLQWVSEHYRVGLMSNIMPGLIEGLQQRGALPTLPYEQIIDSSRVGAIKPERSIYITAAERAGVKPEKILLIDDTRANLMAAEHLGWHVLWFDGYRLDASLARIREVLS